MNGVRSLNDRDVTAPDVCICDQPRPQARFNGECARCRRPYKPELAALRDAWLALVGEAS